jgi:predicted phosphodiesterase
MRLAVLSDIHGNLLALEAVLNDLKAVGGADKTWILGDLCAFGPRPAECLQRIRDVPDVEVISGNTDRYLVTGQRSRVKVKEEADWQKLPDALREREAGYAWTVARLSFADYEYLSKLHHELSLEAPGYGWVIGYHGAPGDDERLLRPDTPDDELLDQMLDREGRLGFGGHTHLPMDRDLGRWRVINVGSVGLPNDAPRACYALVTFTDGAANVELRRVEFDLDALEKDLRQQGHPQTTELVDNIRKAGQ